MHSSGFNDVGPVHPREDPMTLHLREVDSSDISFLREMLYEGVYWRSIADGTNPPFEEALADSNVSKALDGLGERDGDAAVIAFADGIRAGAAWYRFWTKDNHIRGYIEEGIPALVIAVHRDSRRQGIGQQLIEWLTGHAAKHNSAQMSLMVSKDNHAIHLYKKCGFREVSNEGDSVLMLREIEPT
jgi:ribosomal protein S18 acetylase RimI-like enzyme